MAKNNKKVNEPTVEVNENENLVNEEVEKVNEPTVEAPEEPKMPEFKKLICKESFTDKFDDSIVYEIGDELNITDVARRNNLIERGLAVEE